MSFKRDTSYYDEKVIHATPYQRAQQVWDDRIGSARVQAYNWRLTALGLLGLSFALTGLIFWQLQQTGVTPYIVEIREKGEVKAVGPAVRAYDPTDMQISFFLSNFIRNVRSLSVDPLIVRRNWLSAYDFVTGKAKLVLDEHARAEKPFSKVGQRTVSVEINSVVRASKNSFQVRWTEQSYQNGALDKTRRYASILNITVKQPDKEEVLRKNPLGVYITNFDWSQDIVSNGVKK